MRALHLITDLPPLKSYYPCWAWNEDIYTWELVADKNELKRHTHWAAGSAPGSSEIKPPKNTPIDPPKPKRG